MKSWVLTDCEHDTYLEAAYLRASDAGDSDGNYAIHKRRLRGGLREGVDLVEVDNGAIRFAVIPTRGMGLWRIWAGDLEIGWRSPVRGPVHPMFVPIGEPSGIGWLQGFDELLCRCGLESNGAPEHNSAGQLIYPLHGRIANLPAQYVEVSMERESREIALTGIVDEGRLFGNRLRLESRYSTRAGKFTIEIQDTVSNLSAEPAELELLYHINFGPPLLGPGSRLVAAIKELAPRDAHSATDIDTWSSYGPAAPGSREFAHFARLAPDAAGQARALLVAPGNDRGVSVRFNARQLPCFTLWKSQLDPVDGYVTGLEPGINFPNVRSFEKAQGRVDMLEPGASRRFELAIEVHPDATSVRQAEAAIAGSPHGEPRIDRHPRPDWSPTG
jgi:hypothetical protein